MLHTSSFLSKIDEVALPAINDSIEFIYKIDKSFGAIVSKDEKFGLSFWEHGSFFNRTHNVLIEYDVIENLDNKRIKAIKDETIVYFDITGHISNKNGFKSLNGHYESRCIWKTHESCWRW